MFKHFTTRRALKPGAAICAAAALALTGCAGDDDDISDAASDVSVELSPETEEALDEAQEAVEQAEEEAEQAQDEAEEALDDVLASVPDLDEASDDVEDSLPSSDQIEEFSECFGIDFGELGDFEELEDALEQFEDLDLGTLPGGSVPFDMGIFEDFENLSPEEIQELVEEELEELQGALSSMPDVSIPTISMPEFSVPSLPFDGDELEDCLRDAADS
jgi:Rad3-related DNA helicase